MLPPAAVGLATAASAAAVGDGTPPVSKPAPALPESQPDGPLGTTRPADDSGLTKEQQEALAAAQNRAVTTGSAVQVDALTTETATAQANPSGTVTWTTSLLPQRIHRDGAWVPVDTTLAQNTDGTYSPKASAEPLAFSGGGTTPLASMTSGKAELSFSWPSALPTPTVSGATITYPDVLKDVDLRLTANTLGGFSEIIVVKTADAATDPALSVLKLTTHTTGVTVSDDGHDNLQATTPAGQVMFSAPQTLMWDSSTSSTATEALSAEATTADSETAGPGTGAQTARVSGDVSGSTLTLTPDHELLTGSATHYPVYIDPTWNPHYATGSKQHYVEVQQGCPSAKNYDSTQYGDPGVGYNSFSGCIGQERAYYQLGIPSSVWGTHIVSATVNVRENYSASCSLSSDVNLYLSGSISSSTTWNNRPSLPSHLATKGFGPACDSLPSGGFSVTSTIAKKAASKSSSWTFALVNSHTGSGDGNYFKRFANNPSMSIEYNHVPSKPSSLAAKFGTHSAGCGTSTPYPVIGKTLSTTPPTLNATISDGDKDALAATYKYWVNGGTSTTTTSATVASGNNAPKSLSSTFMSGLKTGDVVGWNVVSKDGKDTSPTSSTCHFTVDLTAPDAPTVKNTDGLYPEDTPGTTVAGTPGKFTLTTDSATKFLYNLDASPPTSNTPSSQVATASANTATITLAPTAPGTHTLYVYAVDTAGNISVQQQYQFTAVGHTGKTYASLKDAFNNTAVTDDNNKDAADADGVGATISLQDLKAAGWQPGSKITVDGAAFTLPAFGSSSGDNVMAANQTIQMNDARGQALVFLGFSAYGLVSSQRADDDTSSPVIPDGTSVSGTQCTLGNGEYEDCLAGGPQGSITYSDDTTAQGYHLTVPDWVYGSNALAAVTLPHRNLAKGTQETRSTNIYAFAVPLKRGAPIGSVTLPDLTDAARQYVPGLHIFGMAIRDTTTAPDGARWTGAWSSPNEAAFNFEGTDYRDQTFRIAANPSTAGSSVRIRLSNALGRTPLTIDHTTIATQSSGAAPTGTPTDMTFNSGSRTVSIPAGGEVYSDPISYAAVPGKHVMISLHLANDVPYLVQHSWTSATTTQYVSPVGSGDHTTDTGTTAFTGTGVYWGWFTDILTGIDVTANTNQPTVAVLGDNLVNPTASDTLVPTVNRISDDLATALQNNSQSIPNYGIVAVGVENNRLATNQVTGGPAVLTRLDRDVLDLPGISTVIVDEGLQDIVAGTDETTVEQAYDVLMRQLKRWGIRVVFTTLTPCHGYSPCTNEVDAVRMGTNTWISDQVDVTAPTVSYVDAESTVAVQDPTSTTDPPQLQLSNAAAPDDYDTGDHVNLTSDGYAAITAQFDLTRLGPDPVP
ncbi:hypothetical protein GCM10018793_43870 [Streptomyces sulfonofaciens]|uniref:SGNH hydrolase-type esterase domain-containing protein n=1 Tax=Streptomyces sulfonofaciens TaxID=68272 RepID=A0A919L519_9ACTN|nr:hypothetical protein [Streptomyces sulfonofaciens]GHH82961.1 hypothetical protein GCM10018793_43870 [Streptomyces sulfonofaciens]